MLKSVKHLVQPPPVSQESHRVLFLALSIYILPISRLVGSHGVHHHKYADDTTLYIKLGNQPANDTNNLEHCLADTATWFLENDMQLNPSKSEAMLLGTAAKLRRSSVIVRG